MRRRRSRKRTVAVSRVTVAVFVIAAVVLPAISMSTATVPRTAGVDVVTDSEGLIGVSTATSVQTGETATLVTVTNRFDETASVTVTLVDQTKGSLVVDGTDEGSTATFSLASSGSQDVDIAVTDACSIAGESLAVDISATVDAVSVSLPRTTTVTASGNGVGFFSTASSSLASIARTGDITDLGTGDVGALGTSGVDIDDDGCDEYPRVTTSRDLVILDETGESQTLVSGGVKEERVAVGDVDGDGTIEVLYVDRGDDSLWQVSVGGSPQEITDGGASLRVGSVAGVVDFNDDGDADVVYTHPDTADVCYLDGAVTCVGVEAAQTTAVGPPRDYDGDGTLRVPFIDKGTDAITLVSSTGATETIGSAYTSAARVPIGGYDWDGDGDPELLTVNTNDNDYLYVMYVNGTNERVTDDGGSPVPADDQHGVA